MFYLSALSDNLSSIVDSILEKYGRLELMGQKVSTRVMKNMSQKESGLQTTVDCPISKFKCLRGNLSDDEIERLLKKVDNGEMSFPGLESQCKKIKEIKDLQRHLIDQSACESWEEAKRRY